MIGSRILIVEDETRLLGHLVSLISNENLSVFTCATVKELEHTLSVKSARFDVIVLDRLLHGHDSATLLPQIKEAFPMARIVILSTINTAAEKTALLDLGADDYVSKPFDGSELVARVRALLRRASKDLSAGNVTLKIEMRNLHVAGKDAALTNKEFLLLKALMGNPAKIFTKNELYESVWEMSPEVESNVVEVTINKLRRRLEELGANITIKNARNAGYWLEV